MVKKCIAVEVRSAIFSLFKNRTVEFTESKRGEREIERNTATVCGRVSVCVREKELTLECVCERERERVRERQRGGEIMEEVKPIHVPWICR